MSLATPVNTISILKQFKLHLSKSLGQNFLVDENILNKIGHFAELDAHDIVLEIGPGIGTLTQLLAQRVKSVIAIEYDEKFLPVLDETLSAFRNVKVLNFDAMDFNLISMLPCYALPNKLVSNLPYNIAVPLLIKYLQECPSLTTFIVMVQKEIAARMMGKPSTKNYSSVSLLLQYHCQLSFGFQVSRNVFIPVPNVDSALVKLERLSTPRVKVGDEALLFKLIKAAFAQRRKTIRNALTTNTGLGKQNVELALWECGIDFKARGESLSLDEFGALCRALEKLNLA